MKKTIKIMIESDAWATLALGMIGPIYALFVEEIGGDILDASWAYFAFMITTGVVMYLIGRWEDKVKHKEKLIIGGYILTSIGCLCYIFVFNQFTLMSTQIILGLAGALLTPAFDSMYSEKLDKKEEASEWGAEESMIYVITAIGALIGGYVAKNFGFKILFVGMFISSMFSVFSSLRLLRKK